MGAANWLLRTPVAGYFVKPYHASADAADEAAAPELSQVARAAGLPVPLLIPAIPGEAVCSEDGLTFALTEYLRDTTSGAALSIPEMAQAGHTLGSLHACLRGRAGLRETAANWLAFDGHRKRLRFKHYFPTIERRSKQDDFDLRTVGLLRRRLELLPKAAALLVSLPPLTRQAMHGDYYTPNILFREGALVAVVDFRPPELFLPALEIGRAALGPETMTDGPKWLDGAPVFVREYSWANPDIARSDVRFAPHVWALQLIRSEYGAWQHCFGPIEHQGDLDRFRFQKCETVEIVLSRLDELSEEFASIGDRRQG